MQVKINNKKITLKYTVRSMMMYENMTQKTFTPQTLTDVITFMYCCVVASAKDYSIKFDDFIDYLDSHPEMVTEFGEWLQSSADVNADLSKK